MPYKTECTIFLKIPDSVHFMGFSVMKPGMSGNRKLDSNRLLESDRKANFQFAAMPSADPEDGGWEPVANVKFQSENGLVDLEAEEDGGSEASDPLPPPAEFSEPDALKESSQAPKKYVYGVTDRVDENDDTYKTSETNASTESALDEEVRTQLPKDSTTQTPREKVDGASSPASHASDEGFVDRGEETIEEKAIVKGKTHTIIGSNGEPIIYDAVEPPPEYFTDKIKPAGSQSETKIALEIRELKEREAELRRMRGEREAGAKLERSEDVDDSDERESSSSREIIDETLTSLTITTDEGNFSECGDHTSSEDKSSNGSNSRIMSPDLVSFTQFGSTSEHRPRKITVKPFVEEDAEEQTPVYTRMKNESVIEREIRLAREREEAFRKEKGLCPLPTSTPVHSTAPQSLPPVVNSTKSGHRHSSLVQADIEETLQRERELQNAGKIKTLSEDTVDDKVTRIVDRGLKNENQNQKPSTFKTKKSTSNWNGSLQKPETKPHTPVLKKMSSPLLSSPYSPPPFTPSPTNKPPAPNSTRLTRSLSTTNLSSGGVGGHWTPQKGLMQKFIASRGKLQPMTFVTRPDASAARPNPSSNNQQAKVHDGTTTNGIPTRPMRVQSKSSVLNRNVLSCEEAASHFAPKIKRNATAEEKIQEELKEMKMREEELRQTRARNLGRSHPNLASLEIHDIETESVDSSAPSEVSSTDFSSNSSGHGEPEDKYLQTKSGRRRSTLIAQWEGRIQQTQEV